MCCIYNKYWLGLFLLLLGGCSKAYWVRDPYLERYFAAKPPQNIRIITEPADARVVITTLRNPQLYSGQAPTQISYHPHPHIPSWILVAKEGYRSTAIRIDKDAQNTNLYVNLAPLTEEDHPEDVMAGPMLGKPAVPLGALGHTMRPPGRPLGGGGAGQPLGPPAMLSGEGRFGPPAGHSHPF